MSMKDLLEAFKLIEKNKVNGRLGAKVDKKNFDMVENILSIKFPPTYSLFLKEYGYGGIYDIEIYGIINNKLDAVGALNIVWLILNERKEFGLPNTHIIISDTGDGFWYVLDSSQPNKDGEYPVFIYGFGEDGKSQEKVNEDFGEFLLEQIKWSLSDEDDD